MHEAADSLVHVSGGPCVIGVVVGEQESADLGWIDAVLFDIAQDLIGLTVGTADAGIDQRELITAVDDIHMAIKRVRDVEAGIAATNEKNVTREPHLIDPPILTIASHKKTRRPALYPGVSPSVGVALSLDF
jgi:hypothetical protein